MMYKADMPDQFNGAIQKALRAFCSQLSKTGCTAATVSGYRADIEAYAKWRHENRGPWLNDEISRADLERYRSWLVDRFKPATVNRRLLSLKKFVTSLPSSNASLLRGLADHLRPVSVRPASIKPRWLSRAQQGAFLRAVGADPDKTARTVALTLLYAGLRVSELCAIRWSDVLITPTTAVMRVRASLKNMPREVPIPNPLLEALLELRCDISGQHQLVFQRGSAPPTRTYVEVVVARYTRAAGLGGVVSARVLRHTFCRNLVRQGLGPEQVGMLAGVKDLKAAVAYNSSSAHWAGLLGAFNNADVYMEPPASVVAAVLKRAGNRCERCGVYREYIDFLEIANVVGPASHQDPSSFVALCPNCNVDKQRAPDKDLIVAKLQAKATKNVTRKRTENLGQ